jgi:hypothetical protein
MLSASDLITLPYTPDLTEAGIAYACRALLRIHDTRGLTPLHWMQATVADVAVELALRRLLAQVGVPFSVSNSTPFTDPQHYDVVLGGHRCMLHNHLLTSRAQIRQVRRTPELLLEAPALLPFDQVTAEEQRPGDLFLFAFLLGLTANSLDEMNKALAAGQPLHLVHVLPKKWSHPPVWAPLDGLSVKSDCDQPVTVIFGGQDEARNHVTLHLELPPHRRLAFPEKWYSIAYLHAPARPQARIGLHCPALGEPYIVPSVGWGNAWIYGMQVVLTGWMTREEYRRRATVLNKGMQSSRFTRTREKSLFLPVGRLEPLALLIEQVRAWNTAVRV